VKDTSAPLFDEYFISIFLSPVISLKGLVEAIVKFEA